jgi:hypothetical protein
MKMTRQVFFSILTATTLCACGSSDDDAPQGVTLLDPATEHYGRSYAELAAEWVSYIYAFSPPECLDPINDATGEHCEANQDPESDVFFLVGTYGGVAPREECPVPADKALFFPLVNAWADNAGLPPNDVLSDDALDSYAEGNFHSLVADSLHLEVDGKDVPDLQAGAVEAFPYTLHLAAGPNSYTCQGQDGVEGDFAGRVSGYYALLAPLGPGEHSVRFGGISSDDGHGASVIDVSYSFTSR